MKQRIVVPSVHSAIEEITAEKGIDAPTIQSAIEEAVSEAFRQHYQTDMPVKAVLKSNGRFKIMAAKTVVETVSDPLTEIAQTDPDAKRYGLGDSVFIEISTSSLNEKDEVTDDFGRVAALLAKQIIRQRLREAERRRIYEEYKGREGELIHGKVQRIRHGNIIVDLGRTEGLVLRRDIIPREKFKENDRIKATIVDVRLDAKGPQVFLSRTHPSLVRRLFEMEITEVYDGTVEIKALAREAGFRSKVAVTSRDSSVDPVGACVGQKGIRVQTIVKELGGEKIDIVYWDQEPTTFIRNALLPAECERVILDEDRKIADVIVPEDQLSLAIGRDGQNARLAAKLTEWTVNVRSPGDIEKQQVKDFIRMTFGSTPAEIYSALGVGPETAPVLEQAALTDLEKIATAETEKLVALVGETAATALAGRAQAQLAEIRAKVESMVDESPARDRRSRKKQPVVLTAFNLPGERSVKNIEELAAALDELPGDEVMRLIQGDDLKKWLQEIGTPPDRIADFMARYR